MEDEMSGSTIFFTHYGSGNTKRIVQEFFSPTFNSTKDLSEGVA